MDFTGVSAFIHEYEHDEETGITTITFKNASEVVLGTITIESVKYRALVESISALAKEQVDDWQLNIQRYSTAFNKNTGVASTNFKP